MNICVLLTSVGGLVSAGIIDNLRKIPEVSKIIGTDTLSDAIGFYMVDKGYVVPNGESPEYISVLTNIIEKENVDVVIPCSDEEVLALSKYKEFFRAKNVAIICSSYAITSVAIDKGRMLTFLQGQGVQVPKFYLPLTTDELIQAATELGYPTKAVVVKPRRGRGGRGFRILKEAVDVLSTRDSHEMKLEWFVDAIHLQDHLDVVLMEYLPGEDYSVDVLADNGRILFIVPRKRIKIILGPSRVGEVFWDKEIVNIVELIVDKFKFNSNVNIQLKCSIYPDKNPMIYEINPRISGTIVASAAAGIDLLHYGIRHAFGLDLPLSTLPRPIKMIRYIKEYFVD